jgi:cytochrome b561
MASSQPAQARAPLGYTRTQIALQWVVAGLVAVQYATTRLRVSTAFT